MKAPSLRPDEQTLIRNYRASLEADRESLLYFSDITRRVGVHPPPDGEQNAVRALRDNIVPLRR